MSGITRIAGIEGSLNGAAVTWAWEWSGSAGTAPHVIQMGARALVTTNPINGRSAVTPGHGTITLTPSLSCGEAEVLTLEPITMAIGYEFIDSGECCAGKIDPSECPPSGGGGGECGFTYMAVAINDYDQTTRIFSGARVYDSTFSEIAAVETPYWAYRVAVSPGRDYIAIASGKYQLGELRVVDTSDWSTVVLNATGTRTPSALAFSGDGALFCFGSATATDLLIYETSGWSLVQTIDVASSYGATAAIFHGDSLYYTSGDGLFRLDTDTWAETQLLDASYPVGDTGAYISGFASTMSVSRDGRYLAVGDIYCGSGDTDCDFLGRKVLLWDIATGAPVASDVLTYQYTESPNGYAFSTTSDELGVGGTHYGCGYPGMFILDASDWSVSYDRNVGMVRGIDYSNGGEYLAIAQYTQCEAPSVQVFHRDDMSEVSTFTAPDGQGEDVAFA